MTPISATLGRSISPSHMRLLTPRSFAALLSATLASSAAAAQRVHGRVTDVASGAPLRGAIVSLVHAAGDGAATVLGDDDGRYELRAPHGGRYGLRIDLVGHQSVTLASCMLGADESPERSPRVGLARVRRTSAGVGMTHRRLEPMTAARLACALASNPGGPCAPSPRKAV